MLLANRGWRVTVLEQRADPAEYDPGKGFMYLIDGRGQRCLGMLDPQLLSDLQASSVPATEAKIGILSPKGLREFVSPLSSGTRQSYWVPRHIFVRILVSGVLRNPRIQMLVGASVETLKWEPGCFSAEGTAGTERFAASGMLLVGADGIRSSVRSYLEAWDGDSGNFTPREFDSPAAGLRYKVLTLPNGFMVDTPGGPRQLQSGNMYAVRGTARTGRKLGLGLLPVRPERDSRTANLITFADDPVWDIQDGQDFLAYARGQWPHFPLGELVPQTELQRFAADRGGRFPRPQYTPAAAWVGKGHGNGEGAVLLGDALHAFPPDLGQGVNSALEDVMTLAASMDATEGLEPAAAVQHFESQRLPEAKALITLMCFAAPFQYRQAPWRGRLWSANFLVRALLHKLAPSAFDPPAFLLVQSSELAYSEVLRRARRGATRVALLAAAGAAGILGLILRRL